VRQALDARRLHASPLFHLPPERSLPNRATAVDERASTAAGVSGRAQLVAHDHVRKAQGEHTSVPRE